MEEKVYKVPRRKEIPIYLLFTSPEFAGVRLRLRVSTVENWLVASLAAVWVQGLCGDRLGLGFMWRPSGFRV